MVQYQRAGTAEADEEQNAEAEVEEEEEEEEEEDEEEEEEEIVVKKVTKAAPAIQLSKKDLKKKEMADLDSILAELGTTTPATDEVKPPEPVKEATSNAVEVEVSVDDLSSLGIATEEAGGKKKRKKKKKKKKADTDTATETATAEPATAEATPAASVEPKTLSKEDVKAKLKAKAKKKKQSGNSAAAAAKKEAAKRKVMNALPFCQVYFVDARTVAPV